MNLGIMSLLMRSPAAADGKGEGASLLEQDTQATPFAKALEQSTQQQQPAEAATSPKVLTRTQMLGLVTQHIMVAPAAGAEITPEMAAKSAEAAEDLIDMSVLSQPVMVISVAEEDEAKAASKDPVEAVEAMLNAQVAPAVEAGEIAADRATVVVSALPVDAEDTAAEEDSNDLLEPSDEANAEALVQGELPSEEEATETNVTPAPESALAEAQDASDDRGLAAWDIPLPIMPGMVARHGQPAELRAARAVTPVAGSEPVDVAQADAAVPVAAGLMTAPGKGLTHLPEAAQQHSVAHQAVAGLQAASASLRKEMMDRTSDNEAIVLDELAALEPNEASELDDAAVEAVIARVMAAKGTSKETDLSLATAPQHTFAAVLDGVETAALPADLSGSVSSSMAIGGSSTASTHDTLMRFSRTEHPLMHQPETPVAEQVHVSIQKAFKDGLDRVSVQLQPEALGRVDVQMDVNADGRSQILFTADNRDTLDLLARDAKQLERILQDAGINAGASDMQFNLNQQQSSSQDQEGESNLPYGAYVPQGDQAAADMAMIDPLTGHYTITVNNGVDIRV